jgi:hypothetical protein
MIYYLYNDTVELEFNVNSHRYKINGNYVQGVTTLLGSVTDKSNLINWSANLASDYFKTTVEELLAQKAPITPEVLETISEDARKAHRLRKEAGGDVGTQAHTIIQNYISDNVPLETSDKKVGKVLKGFQSFLDEYQPKFIEAEKVCYSKTYNYAGTYDAIMEINGKRYMTDWKTADPMGVYKGPKHTGTFTAYPQHFLQCAAYDLAYCDDSAFSQGLENYHPEKIKKFDGHAVIYITKSGKCYPFFSYETIKNKDAFVSALNLARRNKELSFENFNITT